MRNLTLILVLIVFAQNFQSYDSRTLNRAQKERVIEQMEQVSIAVGLRCQDCHADANAGVNQADFNLLTDLGKYAKDSMLPLSEAFQVKCDYCHSGRREFTKPGWTARRHHEQMALLNQKEKKADLLCNSCHIVPRQQEQGLIPGVLDRNTANPFSLKPNWKFYKGLWQKYEPPE